MYFTVGLSLSKAFGDREILKFDQIITNVGGGYIDDNNNTDYGKFIAPQNGTYQFNANLYNDGEWIGADLVKNGQYMGVANNGEEGTGSLSVILDLEEGDEVYLTRPCWVPNNSEYDQHVTSFSGFLIRPKA